MTKTRESGGIVHAEADHTFVTYGDDLLTAKFNRRQSEAGFDYNFTYLDMDYGYAFSDNQITEREWKCDKQAYLYHNHNARLHYSHQEKGKHYFHAAAQLQYFKQPHDNMTATLTAPDTASPTQQTIQDRQTYLMPSMEFYYERNLPGKQLLALNLVGTYTSNESENHFTNAQGQAILSQGGTDQEGKKWSLIGEGYYEKEGGKLNFSAGIKNTWSRIDNHFARPRKAARSPKTTRRRHGWNCPARPKNGKTESASEDMPNILKKTGNRSGIGTTSSCLTSIMPSTATLPSACTAGSTRTPPP